MSDLSELDQAFVRFGLQLSPDLESKTGKAQYGFFDLTCKAQNC